MIKQCDGCGKEFEETKDQRFCTRKCADDFTFKNRRGIIDGKYTKFNLNIKKIKILYLNKGLTLTKIGEIIGCNHKTISKRLKEIGVEIRPTNYYGIWNKGLTKEIDERVSGFSKRMKINNPMFNKETLEKMRGSRKGQRVSVSTEFKKGHKESLETRERRLQNTMKGLHLKPNTKEQIVISIIKENNLPFNYVGDGQVMIGGFNPDFLSKNPKHIIEVFGDYWHNLPNYKKRDKRRIETYTRYGYKTLIIWEHELENTFDVLNKIKRFLNE